MDSADNLETMATPALDFGAFTNVEKIALLAAAKAEILNRTGVGSVQTGSSTAQSFSMAKYSEDGLIRLINALTVELGYPQPETRVAPNFSGCAFGPDDVWKPTTG